MIMILSSYVKLSPQLALAIGLEVIAIHNPYK